MKKGVIIMALIWGVTAGCESNEISFYIEHIKVQPQAPECSVTESDGFISGGTLDLAFGNPYSGFYLVTNQLMAREDYSNAIAEPNGIIIDGVETYVRSFEGVRLSNTEYYLLEMYMEPENSAIAAGVMISSVVAEDLASQWDIGGCPYWPELNGSMGGGNIVYSEVRFLGHSSGGTDVVTPWFSFPINVCCGCLIDWTNCMSNCSMYCEDPESHTFCSLGVYNGSDGFDCRHIYNNPNAVWQAGPGDDCADPYACTCADCDEAS